MVASFPPWRPAGCTRIYSSGQELRREGWCGKACNLVIAVLDAVDIACYTIICNRIGKGEEEPCSIGVLPVEAGSLIGFWLFSQHL